MRSKLCVLSLSLTGNASKWYYNLDLSRTKVWNKQVKLFVDQFIFNIMIDMTLRNLETTKQGFNETFFEHMMRWKKQSIKDG